MRQSTEELVNTLNADQVKEITDTLLKRKRRETQSLAISTASLLSSQLAFLRMPDAKQKVDDILRALLSAPR